MVMGVMLLSIGFISASFAQRIWQLFISQGLLIGMGVGFIHIPSLPFVSR